MKRGYIKLYRKIQDNPLYKKKRRFSRSEAWIDLLLSTHHKADKVMVDFEEIPVKRGEVFTSQLGLSKKWNWGIASVNRFLNFLKSGNQITYRGESKYTIISILNWGKYQMGEGEAESKRKGERKPERKPNGNQTETVKNGEECKRNKEIKDLILAFKGKVNEVKDFDPEVNWEASVRRINQLTNRKTEPLTSDEILEIFDFYLKLPKAESGVSLMSALSSHTLNLWKAQKKKSAQMYVD